MYAVIRTGGKQYTVRQGDTLNVETLSGEPGERVELVDVLMLGEGADVTVGQPLVEGAKVLCDVVEHGKAKKIIVFKYKSKTRYRRKIGHRQRFTRLMVKEIVAP
ncbi:MAG: 50S ribosomal protein L21 [Dehalococcoidia bacterium]